MVRSYTPKETVNAEAWLRLCCIQQVGSPCLAGPLSVGLSVNIAVPQSWANKKRAAALSGDLRPTGKADLDNYIKVLDALNGILWRDDAQIVAIMATKQYAAEPSMVLIVKTLDLANGESSG